MATGTCPLRAAAFDAVYGTLERAPRRAGVMPDPLRRSEGDEVYAHLRAVARTLFQATVEACHGLCPQGFPHVDDSGIPGTGGTIGIRSLMLPATSRCHDKAGGPSGAVQEVKV
jgi:hypothetical protein